MFMEIGQRKKINIRFHGSRISQRQFKKKRPYESNILEFNKGKKIRRHVLSWLSNMIKAKYKKIHLSS